MDTFEGELPGDEGASSRGGVVGARGTSEGLVLRVDGRIEADNLCQAVEEFVHSRERFLAGNDVILEWVGEVPADEMEQGIKDLLKERFNISVRSSCLKRPTVVRRQSVPESAAPSEPPFREDAENEYPRAEPMGLFGGIEGLSEASQRAQKQSVVDGNLWDDPNARVIFSMLRSGQRIETEHSLVVFGDVNSGAELVAGGDIVVLGTLRGVAHAGAYDETGGGRTIFSLNFQPTQLRIGSIISRGAGDTKEKGPEIARVDKDMIVVEPFSAKVFLSRRRDQ